MFARFVLSLLATAAVCTHAAAQNVSLALSSWLAPTHILKTNALEPWMKDVTNATGGRVTFRMLPKLVGSTAAQVDVVRDGLADVGFIAHGYVPGRFVLQEIGELPFLGNRGAAVSPAYWRIFEKYLSKFNEHEGVVVLSTMAASAGRLHTSKKVVTSMQDLAGLKIRVPGGATTEIMSLLGTTPVLKPVNETYELISTGVVDGAIFPMASVAANKMLDKLTRTTNVDGGLYNATYSLFINKGKWEAISEADRAAVRSVSGEKFAVRWGTAMDEQDVAAEAEAKKRGNVITVASPKFIAELQERLKPVEQKWINAAKARKLDNVEQVLAAFRSEIKSRQGGSK